MFDPLQTVLIVLSLALVVVTIGYVVRDRVADDWLFGGFALLEVGLLVQCVVGIGQLIGTDRDVAGAVFVGYLVGTLAVAPAGVVWALGERSRAGTAVLVVAGIVVPVRVLRLDQIWSAA